MQPHEISYVNVYATPTPIGDVSETKAIYGAFGSRTPVSSTKPMTGYECWVVGASELMCSILVMQHDFMTPNINFEAPDEDSVKLNIISGTQQKSVSTSLNNSFGLGGTNPALVTKKMPAN